MEVGKITIIDYISKNVLSYYKYIIQILKICIPLHISINHKVIQIERKIQIEGNT